MRAGTEVFGSIWATVHGPLTPEKEQTFTDCAKLVAARKKKVKMIGINFMTLACIGSGGVGFKRC